VLALVGGARAVLRSEHMKKTVPFRVRWLGYQRDLVAGKMRTFDLPADSGTKFVDLASVEDADQGGVYAEALLYATNSDRVFNIALTGPHMQRVFFQLYPATRVERLTAPLDDVLLELEPPFRGQKSRRADAQPS